MNLLRRNAVIGIILQLDASSAGGFVDGLLHAVCNIICIHDYLAVHVSCSTTRSLRQRTVTAQEALFISIQDGYKRNFRKVETLTQQVDAYQDIINASSQVVHDLHSIQPISS